MFISNGNGKAPLYKQQNLAQKLLHNIKHDIAQKVMNKHPTNIIYLSENNH